MQVRSLDEAKGALQCGLDALIAQAAEGERTSGGLMTVLPAVVDAVSVPVIASGSIVDGRSLAAALALGAEAVRCGTRFLSATESDARAEYERRVGAAKIQETVSMNLFTPEWPDQPAGVSRIQAANRTFKKDQPFAADISGDVTREYPPAEEIPETVPAAAIVREMTREAEGILAKYSSLLAVA
jgi:hypothetical protein